MPSSRSPQEPGTCQEPWEQGLRQAPRGRCFIYWQVMENTGEQVGSGAGRSGQQVARAS